MISGNSIICSCILFTLFDSCLGLVQLTNKNNNIIIKEVINSTINDVFKTLKLDNVSDEPRPKEYSDLHNYFKALTLGGNENIIKIEQLVKVNSNEKASLVDIINDVLEEEDLETTNATNIDDRNVTNFINNFLINLQILKQEFNDDKEHTNVNIDVLEDLIDSNGKLNNNLSKIRSSINSSKENEVIASDNEFWEPSGRRIFKGERTKIKHYPFMAVVQIFNSFHCAGSIIKSDLIITASSCVQLAWNNRLFRENPAFLSVRVGSSFYSGGGEVIPVLEVYFHPSYNPKTLRNNICILRLVRHIKFKRRESKVKKIDFDRHDSKLPYNTYGVTVVGWGAKEHSPIIGNPWKNIISYAVLDVYPLKDCQDIYSREYVTNKNFCAGFLSRGGGACNRDVGGPGIVDGKLMGVISFGSPLCGMPDTPTVFTKVGYYTDWIEDIMEQNVPVSKKRTTLKPVIDLETFTYRSSKPTTFKIPPITGKTMTPIPISQIDNQLRNMDEKVFKDFLASMFNSKEIQEYQDIFKDNLGEIVNITDNDENGLNQVVLDEVNTVTEAQNVEGPFTQIVDDLDNDEDDKPDLDTAFTIMDEENPSNKPDKHDFDKEMSKIIDNVDLERIVKEEVMVSSNHDAKSDVFEINTPDNTVNSRVSAENVKIEDKNDKEEEGMSIPDNIFEDMTRAKENTEGVLPESVLYELLSEVIKDEIQNINVESYKCFIFRTIPNFPKKKKLFFIKNVLLLKTTLFQKMIDIVYL